MEYRIDAAKNAPHQNEVEDRPVQLPIGFAMPTIGGEVECVWVPAPGDSDLAAMACFGEASTRISRELHLRDKANAEQREWVQRVTYQLLSMMITNGFVGLFEQRIRNFDRKRLADSQQLNPFQIGLLAIFAHDKGAMGEGRRHLFGKRLWYAYRHYVPHEFLAAFLRQVWTSDAPQRADDYIEPDFVSWLTMERAVDPAPQSRGQYPPAIEETVAQIKGMRDILLGTGMGS